MCGVIVYQEAQNARGKILANIERHDLKDVDSTIDRDGARRVLQGFYQGDRLQKEPCSTALSAQVTSAYIHWHDNCHAAKESSFTDINIRATDSVVSEIADRNDTPFKIKETRALSKDGFGVPDGPDAMPHKFELRHLRQEMANSNMEKTNLVSSCRCLVYLGRVLLIAANASAKAARAKVSSIVQDVGYLVAQIVEVLTEESRKSRDQAAHVPGLIAVLDQAVTVHSTNFGNIPSVINRPGTIAEAKNSDAGRKLAQF